MTTKKINTSGSPTLWTLSATYPHRKIPHAKHCDKCGGTALAFQFKVRESWVCAPCAREDYREKKDPLEYTCRKCGEIVGPDSDRCSADGTAHKD